VRQQRTTPAEWIATLDTEMPSRNGPHICFGLKRLRCNKIGTPGRKKGS
jgi:hypothetical protein